MGVRTDGLRRPSLQASTGVGCGSEMSEGMGTKKAEAKKGKLVSS